MHNIRKQAYQRVVTVKWNCVSKSTPIIMHQVFCCYLYFLQETVCIDFHVRPQKNSFCFVPSSLVTINQSSEFIYFELTELLNELPIGLNASKTYIVFSKLNLKSNN